MKRDSFISVKLSAQLSVITVIQLLQYVFVKFSLSDYKYSNGRKC